MRKLFFLIGFVLTSFVQAQSAPDSLLTTPFEKGKNYVGLSGSISSSKLNSDQPIRLNDDFVNHYVFDIKLGKFIAAKHLLGFIFNANRRQNSDYIDVEKEVFGVGPWYRYYIGNSPNMGLYAETAALFSNYYEYSEGYQGYFYVEQELRGRGLSGVLGFGYAYVIAKKVSFEVGFTYSLASYDITETNLLNGNQSDLKLNKSDYRFSFGFVVLLNKIRENE